MATSSERGGAVAYQEVRQAMEAGGKEADRLADVARAQARAYAREEEAVARASQDTLATCAEAVQASRRTANSLVQRGEALQLQHTREISSAHDALYRSERAYRRINQAHDALTAAHDALELVNSALERAANGDGKGALSDAVRSEKESAGCVPARSSTSALLHQKIREAKESARRAADRRVGQWLVDAREAATRAGAHAADAAHRLRELRQKRELAREHAYKACWQVTSSTANDESITATSSSSPSSFPELADPEDEEGTVLLSSNEGPPHAELLAGLEAYEMLGRSEELRNFYWQQRTAQLEWRLQDASRADLLSQPAVPLDAVIGFFMLEACRGIASRTKLLSALERSTAAIRSACEAALQRAEHSRDVIRLAERLSLHQEALANARLRATPLAAAVSAAEWRHSELCEARAEREARRRGVSGVLEGCEIAAKSGEALRKALGRRQGPPDGTSSRYTALRAAVERAMLPEVTSNPGEWIESALELMAVTSSSAKTPAAQLLDAAEVALATEAASIILDAFSAKSGADLALQRPPGGPRSEAIQAAKEAAKRCKTLKAPQEVIQRVSKLAAERVSVGALAAIVGCKRLNGAGAQMLDGELGKAEAELVGKEHRVGARALMKALATGEVALASPIAHNVGGGRAGAQLVSECVQLFIHTVHDDDASRSKGHHNSAHQKQQLEQQQHHSYSWWWYSSHNSSSSNAASGEQSSSTATHQSGTTISGGTRSGSHHQHSGSWVDVLSLEDAHALIDECNNVAESSEADG